MFTGLNWKKKIKETELLQILFTVLFRTALERFLSLTIVTDPRGPFKKEGSSSYNMSFSVRGKGF